MFAAIRRASSFVSSFAAAHRPGSSSLFIPMFGDVSHDIFDRIDPVGFAKVARGVVALVDNPRIFLALFWATSSDQTGVLPILIKR